MSPAARRDFALYTSDGKKRFVLSYKDEGIALESDGLAWMKDGVAQAKPYGAIAAIRLRRTPTPNQDTGLCTVTFTDGSSLNIVSGTRTAFADEARAAIYRDFVIALHWQLAPADRARIAFATGAAGGAGFAWLRPAGKIAMVAAVLFFVGVPFGFALLGIDQRGYALAGGGVILTFFLFWQWRRSDRLITATIPKSYSPDQVPADLLP